MYTLKPDTKAGCIAQTLLIVSALIQLANFFGYNKENTFDVLRDMNQLTSLETFWMLFGQQLCAAVAFTALEIREDLILLPEENERRGYKTQWPRSRVYETIYLIFPLSWAATFAFLLAMKVPVNIFSTYQDESWACWCIKMVVWFVVWEFLMYWFHRTAHAFPWLYKIAHKEHHVVMDFPLGPHAPAGEKLAHYLSSIVTSKVVGVSAGSWVLALNVLMTQCVLEHEYSSFTLPFWHGICFFNTSDIHQAHHVNNQKNFGYAFNIFDPVFGTGLEPEVSPARQRFLKSSRSKNCS